MNRKKRGRGKPRLNDSETILRSYNISERQYKEFKDFCDRRGLKVSEVIRVAVGQLMKEGKISELLEDSEMRSLAVELLKKIRS